MVSVNCIWYYQKKSKWFFVSKVKEWSHTCVYSISYLSSTRRWWCTHTRHSTTNYFHLIKQTCVRDMLWTSKSNMHSDPNPSCICFKNKKLWYWHSKKDTIREDNVDICLFSFLFSVILFKCACLNSVKVSERHIFNLVFWKSLSFLRTGALKRLSKQEWRIQLANITNSYLKKRQHSKLFKCHFARWLLSLEFCRCDALSLFQTDSFRA